MLLFTMIIKEIIIMADFALVAAIAPWALLCRHGKFAVLTILHKHMQFPKNRIKSGVVCLHRADFRENLMKGRW